VRLQPALLDHHERQLLHARADVLHHGDGRRPDTVLVDYPFVPNPPGTKWMEDLPLSLEDRTKILSGNCKQLLKM